MNMEIHTVVQDASAKNGTNTAEIPEVGSHFIGSLQKARLARK